MNPCKKVLVVGCGLMGAGITQVIAQAGLNVIASDRTEADIERGKSQILKGISKKSNEEQQRILSHITFTTNMEDGKDSDLVVEAVPEKLEIKQQVFKQLDRFMKPEAILASNTSSLSIAAISSVTNRPEKVVGLHFFSPVPIMKLLEIVQGINTGEQTLEFAQSFAEQINKKTIVANDYPGFTVNRVLVPMLNEAAYLVMEGNDPEEVDNGMMLGANHPIGPLKLSDMIGIDVLLHTLESLYEGFNDSKYRPCPLLKRMVDAGHYGKKTGQGFYSYQKEKVLQV
ncbi:3-hydroxyacyl-CoA dehydrogenase family protein [Oceanobacillus senegalensis]|uniref:3-hydroxyacyl-CoA dehydrogenase family protein n=1 Tax=Oceanobacillus senegalensis TaxID=1936063 RepID=UPI000A30CBDC|nr:3-hydroxyacyl-CoA dehydrogenase NAD-binding domain-containing protein [Oceanobacillus senegalensis]